MPKLAATLASLLLIASSIGVNIARYPQVGRAIDPSQAAAAEAASAAPAAQSSSGETASADALPAKADGRTAEAPRPVDAARELVQTQRATEKSPAPPPLPASTDVPIIDVRPMLPAASEPPGEDHSATATDELRRLPPVEDNALAVVNTEPDTTDIGTAYPATSTP